MPVQNQYTVTFLNRSSNSGNVAIFQDEPTFSGTNANLFTLAWFSKFTNPNTDADFQWTIDYSMVWAESGELVPGVLFRASQDLPANLTTTNKVTLNFNGGYQFLNQRPGTPPGSLLIEQDGTIPLRRASVGIGVSGSPTHAVDAQPNINLSFTPKPKYFMAFGTFQEGEVLDVGAITNVVELQFPPNVFSLTAVLNIDNTITVMTTAQANAKLLAARETDPEAVFGADLVAA